MPHSPSLLRQIRRGFGLAALLALLATGALATQAPEQPDYDKTRRDNVLGTRDENIDFGRDPRTGDIYYQIDPPRGEPAQPSTRMGPIFVEPEVRFGKGYYNNQGGYGGALDAPPAGGGVYYHGPGEVKGR